jgi:hypothetical protein
MFASTSSQTVHAARSSIAQIPITGRLTGAAPETGGQTPVCRSPLPLA